MSDLDLDLDPVVDPMTAVPPPADPAPGGVASAPPPGGPAIDMTNNIREIHGPATFVNKMELLFEREIVTRQRVFVSDPSFEVDSDQEDEIRHVYAGDDAVVNDLLDQLDDRRVLLLTGTAKIGKGATALYLATLMAERRDLERSTLRVTAPERQLIDIPNIARQSPDFAERVIVFTDAITSANRELLSFFARTERAQWQHVTHCLGKNRAYLIFTASTEQAAAFQYQAAQHIACHELLPPEPGRIEEAFDKWLSWIERKHGPAAHERLELLRTDRVTILAELKTIPRISDFLAAFVRGKNDVATALREINDAPHWFGRELVEDVDAWCAAATLAIAQPVGGEPIAWMDFDRLRRRIADRLKADQEMFPRGAKPAAETAAPPGSAQGLGDDALLTRCRAVIGKDAERLGDVVQFREPSLAPAVWKTLLTCHRRVLTQLVPVLREISEQDRSSGRASMRVLATQALGRIGEIDPTRLTLPLIRHWTTATEAQRPLVGRLLQGVLASDNEPYLETSLRELDQLLDSAGIDAALTVIASYAQLGVYDPDRAMYRLGTIAVERIAATIDGFHQLARASEILTSSAKLQRNRSAAVLRAQGEALAELAALLSADHAEALVGLAKAVAHLCITHYDDAVRILAMMRDWTARGDGKTGVLVALLFLHDGVADELDQFTAHFQKLGFDGVHPLLYSLRNGDAVDELAGFVADVRGALNGTFALPVSLQRAWEARLYECLTSWAQDAVTHPAYRDPVVELFVALTTIRARTLRKDVVDVLAGAAFRDDERMRAFAAEVRGRLKS